MPAKVSFFSVEVMDLKKKLYVLHKPNSFLGHTQLIQIIIVYLIYQIPFSLQNYIRYSCTKKDNEYFFPLILELFLLSFSPDV